MSARVCEARAKAWEAYRLRMSMHGTRWLRDDGPVGLIPCPPPSALPSGCGAAAGEPCREPAWTEESALEAWAALTPEERARHLAASNDAATAGNEHRNPTGERAEDPTQPVIDVSALLAERDRLAVDLRRLRRDSENVIEQVTDERDALRASDAAVRAALGARDGEETAEAGRRVSGDRDHLKRREVDIIAAVEPVADGGQYRNDIVSAIQWVRRERNALRAMVVELLASAYPHPVEHPTMTATWAKARALLAVCP